MSNTEHDRTAGQGAPSGDWWSRRPRRSVNDRKIAGVAGGLGRTLGVDPVLLRVGFVILALLGPGVVLYLLSWLLLPADGDEVSAAESLIGKGHSATSPVLTVGLAIAAAISVGWIPFWGGLPLFPLVVAGVITVLVLRKRARSGGCAQRSATGRTDAVGNTPPWSDRLEQHAESWGAKAESWGAQAEQWVARQPWSGSPPASSKPNGPSSPFAQPPFWAQGKAADDQATDDTAAEDQGQKSSPRVNLSKAPTEQPTPTEQPGPAEPTPPAWDPLGVAPFAWDLPEPSPLPPPPPARYDRGVIGRVTMGAVLLIGGLATVGTFLGWWQLSWAGVAATALLVVAVGLLIGSLNGGRGKSLIGPGIFLSMVTLALTVTGISGTEGYGQQTWTPTNQATLSSEYVLNGGQGELDLRNLTVPAGQTLTTGLEVRAGQASVIVPDDMNLNVTCSTNAGQVDCLGNVQDGLRSHTSNTQHGSSDQGEVNLTVHVGAGQAEVRNG